MIAVDIGNTRAKFGYFPVQSFSSTLSGLKNPEAEHGKRSIAERLVQGRSLLPIPATVSTFPEPASNIKISYNKNNIDSGENLFGVAERKLIADWLCDKRDVVDWYISVTASCCGVNSFVEELSLIEPEGRFNLLTNGDVPIISNVELPAKTGIDRLLDAVAAVRFVGGKLCVADSGNKDIQRDNRRDIQQDVETIIVVDAGTAVTVNMVSVNNNASNNSAVFEGGVILAGLRVLSVALNQVSSKLPEVGLEQFQSVDLVYPAKNTESAILTGILGSLIAAIDFFVNKARVINPNNIDKNLPIIFTGGDAAVIGKLFADEFSGYNLSIVPELTLIGIAIAVSENDRFLSLGGGL